MRPIRIGEKMKAAKKAAKTGDASTEWVAKLRKKFGRDSCTVCGHVYKKMSRKTLMDHFNDGSPDGCPTTDD